MKKDFAFLSPPVVFALIAIVAVLTIVVIIFVPFGTGAKVTVKGTVQHISGEGANSQVSVDFDTYIQEGDPYLFNTGQPGLWFWVDSQSVKIKLFVDGQEVGSTESNAESNPNSFEIVARHVSPGTKSCKMEAYILTGGFLGIGATENKVGETSFSLNIGEW